MIWISAIFVVLSIILDQVTKIIAENNLQGTDGFVVIPKVLSFSYVENKGAAFGMFSDSRWVFMIFSTIAIIAMVYILLTSKNKHPLFIVSLSMLIGGGIGNMIDRIFRGYVIDFFKVLFVDFAVFNVADCFVTVGAFLLAFYLIFMYKEPEKSSNRNTSNDYKSKELPEENDENIGDFKSTVSSVENDNSSSDDHSKPISDCKTDIEKINIVPESKTDNNEG